MTLEEVMDLRGLMLGIEGDLKSACEASRMGYVQAPFLPVAAAIHDGSKRVKEVAEFAGITQQAVGKTLRLMEKHGLVVIGTDSGDGRAKSLSLTIQGEAFITIAETVCNSWGYE